VNACCADLGFVEAGSRVSVDISAPARVRLMEPEELVIEQFGGPTLCTGGFFGAGRVTLRVPEDGHWLHVVDIAGRPARVGVSNVRIQRRRRLRSVLRL
jgi:Domain of unknown function (DUF1883)